MYLAAGTGFWASVLPEGLRPRKSATKKDESRAETSLVTVGASNQWAIAGKATLVRCEVPTLDGVIDVDTAHLRSYDAGVEPFDSLGRELQMQWRRADYAEDAFPELAAAALDKAQPHRHVGIRDVLDFVAESAVLPKQGSADFGEPPVNVYFDDRLFIEVLFWADGTTAIHQHAFSGAFCVLEGSSVHTRYTFEEQRALGEHIRLGELALQQAELLRPGMVRRIHHGPAMIHALFHLDRPTLSLVARTHGTRLGGPQYEYARSGLALNPFHQPESQARKLRVLRMAMLSAHPELQRFASRLVEDADLLTVVRVLQTLNMDDAGMPLLPRLLEHVRRRFGSWALALEQTLSTERQARYLTVRRTSVFDETLRYLLALLLNLEHREPILRLMAERFPQEKPAEAVMRCLSALAKPAPLAPQGALGIEFDDHAMWVVHHMLHGHDERRMLEEAQTDPSAPAPADIQRLTFVLPFNSVLKPLLSA